MKFNKHYNLEGKHAFLGASKYHWINYDIEKIQTSYLNFLGVQRGTRLHAFAAEAISLKEKLSRSKKTLNSYVNDAIGYRMKPEQVLMYSDNCFGTADAISFRKEHGRDKLRIHDLKTGVVPAHIEQLEIYAALFCLEYGYDPSDIDIELRIYQSDDVVIEEPDPNDIHDIMDKIVEFDKVLNHLKEEE